MALLAVVSSVSVQAEEYQLQEGLFEIKGKMSEDGGPVYQKPWSCDGENWFKEKPVVVALSQSVYTPPPSYLYYSGYSGGTWSGVKQGRHHRRHHHSSPQPRVEYWKQKTRTYSGVEYSAGIRLRY